VPLTIAFINYVITKHITRWRWKCHNTPQSLIWLQPDHTFESHKYGHPILSGMKHTISYLLFLILSLAFPELGFSQNQWKTVELDFESRGARLVGTLYLPTGQGPHPVMIGVHGSGYVDRSDLYQGEAARYFASRGVAFFMYDKRGVGESSGTYPGSYSSSMVIYATDALAAADLMASRDDIDDSQIGLWGVSQAGWIIPLAASMDQERIAFTVIVSGPTVSILEENAYSDLTGQTQGRPTGASHESIDEAMAKLESKGLDASVFIAELRIPGLWIYGALDQSVPWRQGIKDLKEIAEEWDRDFTWKVFEGANHGLRAARTGGPWERPTPTQPVDGYLEYMADWLRSHVGLSVLNK